jgi:hypothetical protein
VSITTKDLERMVIGNPLAEPMLAQRKQIGSDARTITRLEGELAKSETVIRNLQHELDLANREINRMKSL